MSQAVLALVGQRVLADEVVLILLLLGAQAASIRGLGQHPDLQRQQVAREYPKSVITTSMRGRSEFLQGQAVARRPGRP